MSAALGSWAVSLAITALAMWVSYLIASVDRRRAERLAAVVVALPRCSECGELARWYPTPARGSILLPRCDVHVWSRRNLMEEFGHAPALRELRASDLPAETTWRASAEEQPRIMGNVVQVREILPTIDVVQRMPPPAESSTRGLLPLLYGPDFEEDAAAGSYTALSPQYPDEQETIPLSRESFRQASARYEASRKVVGR